MLSQLIIPFILGLSGACLFFAAQSQLEKWKKRKPSVVVAFSAALFCLALAIYLAGEYISKINITFEKILIRIPLPAISISYYPLSECQISLLSALLISTSIMMLGLAHVAFGAYSRFYSHGDETPYTEHPMLFSKPSHLALIVTIAITFYKTAIVDLPYRSEQIILFRPAMLMVFAGFILTYLATKVPREEWTLWRKGLLVLGNAIAWTSLIIALWV